MGYNPVRYQIDKLFTVVRTMPDKVQLFTSEGEQAVRLPERYRFAAKQVYIRKNERTGDVILSPWPTEWAELFAAIETLDGPGNLLDEERQPAIDRDPLRNVEAQ